MSTTSAPRVPETQPLEPEPRPEQEPSTARSGTLLWPAYRAEWRKLTAQLPARVLALLCLAGPLAFAVILKSQSGVPADTLFGMWVHRSGFALALVVLSFAGSWGFPVLAGVLAGDIFSAEDRHGTWKTVLTRSSTRREVFGAKVLSAGVLSVVLLLLTALSSLLSGALVIGAQPLVNLTGSSLSPGTALALVILSWLTSLLPMLAFLSLAVLFSTATRNGIAGVLGPVVVALVMQLLALIGTGSWLHTWLVGSAFDGWHGLLSSPQFLRPLVLASVVSLAWITVCLSSSWWILRRRDFAGPPVTRRPGWVVPVGGTLAATALVALLAAAASWGPPAVTAARLEAAIKPTFNRLTVLQQRLLGRHVPAGVRLNDVATCLRRSRSDQGPGADWVCTMNLVIALSGSNPFSMTPVSFDVSVKANGCYKAEGPPAFVGQPQIRTAQGINVVNPLYAFDGCFDPT